MRTDREAELTGAVATVGAIVEEMAIDLRRAKERLAQLESILAKLSKPGDLT